MGFRRWPFVSVLLRISFNCEILSWQFCVCVCVSKYYASLFFMNKLLTMQALTFFSLKILAIFASIHIITQLLLTETRLITPFTKIWKWTGPAAVHPVVTDWTIFNTS